MILAFLVLATDSCSFESAFRAGAAQSEDALASVSVDSLCEGMPAEKQKEARLAFDLARDSAAVLQKAELQKIPSSYDEYNDLMELADRKIKLQALKDEVADRDLRIQQMKHRLQKNSQLSR